MEQLSDASWYLYAVMAYAFASEVIGATPKLKANSVIQVIMHMLGSVYGKKKQ